LQASFPSALQEQALLHSGNFIATLHFSLNGAAFSAVAAKFTSSADVDGGSVASDFTLVVEVFDSTHLHGGLA